MIRPFTIVTFMMACGSGLYLYQSKHEVQMLDKTISQAEHNIGLLRDQSRKLANDWTILNEPERLRKFSDLYLSLKPTSPSQYASLADLDARLPPPRAAAPSGTAEDGALVVGEPDTTTEIAPPAETDDALPVPPMPAAPPPAPAARPAEHKVAAKPTVAEAAPSRPASADQHVAETRPPRPPDHAGDLRPVELHPPAPPQPVRTAAALPRPMPANPPPSAPPSPTVRPPALPPQPTSNTGSLLGIARGAASPPAPRPMPVNVTNWYNAN